MKKEISKDIAIIGAGPSGLFTVFEAGMSGYSCVVIDSLEEAGGQLAALYPEKPIYDIPGYPSILAGELVKKLEEQAAPFEPTYLFGESVLSLVGESGDFTLETEEHTVKAKVVIVAAGGGMFAPRKPPLDNLEEYEGVSAFYAVRKKDAFKGKEVVIAGGGDSAADWAVLLSDIASHVHIIHRRKDFRAADETVRQIKEKEDAGKITLHTPYQLSALHGENGVLSEITIADLDGEKKNIKAEALLCFFGLSPDLGPIGRWGLELNGKKIAVDPATMQTSIEGILAVGDVADYGHKISLILVGFAESAVAMKTVQSIIDPDKKFKVVYSTSKGLPSNS